jgi:hypothetical protein
MITPLLVLSFGAVALSAPDTIPVIPVGDDAYLMWDRWPGQRIGARAYMRSTYDRAGGNEGADASHFLYQEADDFNVTLDVEGPGVLYFARYNHWHGSPWHYEVDGRDHLVRETSTADPDHPVARSVFIPEKLFPNPLVWTWSDTKGADLTWVPIAFENSFRMAYSRTRYGTGYYIYHQFVPGAPLSRPLRAWDGKTPPGRSVLKLLDKSGTPLFTELQARKVRGGACLTKRVALLAGDNELFRIDQCGPRMIRALVFSIPRARAEDIERATLRITWDDRAAPSVEAPLCLFYGAGTLHNCAGREYLVKGFPIYVRYDPDRVTLACYYPMPFFRSARIALENHSSAPLEDIDVSVIHVPYDEPPNSAGYFHATYQDFPNPKPGVDLTILDTRGVENSNDWSGQFVGMSWIFSHRAVLNTLEGDPRFFFDDSHTPQCYGTGTEEWGGGGDYWGGRNMTLPLAGHPCGARDAKSARHPKDLIESAYRFLLADLMPFGHRAALRLEHGGRNESKEHYETVAYWYGLPSASLLKTDELDVGDLADEQAHHYDSPAAAAPETTLSRYEWSGADEVSHLVETGPEHLWPPQEETGRRTTGTSEFTMRVDPRNQGVLLRRSLDYSHPNQRAEVFVSDAEDAAPAWKRAGIWYLAGSNTCVYSNPREELGATQHVVQTSDRRFRDDEFLIGRDLTSGRKAIRIRAVFTPVNRPLVPGIPFPAEPAWSELRYAAYCFVAPCHFVSSVVSSPSSRSITTELTE